MNCKKMYTGYLFAIISAVIFGTMPMMAKFIYAEGVNSLTLVFLRNLLSLPVLAVLAWRQKGSLRIPAKTLPFLSLIALMGCCVTPLLLFSAYVFIPSGMATVFHFVYPAMVLVGGIVFLKKKAGKWDLLAVLLCVAGIFLFYDPAQPMDLRGAALALASGLTFAVYVLLLTRLREPKLSGFLLTFYTALVCAVAMLAVCVFSGQMALPVSVKGWALSLVFAVGVNAGAVFLFQQGTLLIGGERASILSTFEPITSLFAGVLVFRETIRLGEGLGSLLVIAASILVAVMDLRRGKKSAEGCK